MAGHDAGTMSAHDSRPAVQTTAPTPVLFRVLDAAHPSALPSRHSLADIEVVSFARGGPATDRAIERALAIHVPDPRMSTRHAELRRGREGWALEDLGSKNGCFVNGERRRRADLHDGDLIELGWTFFLFREALALPLSHPPDYRPEDDGTVLSTLSPAFARVCADLATIAPTSLTVLIQGETGTGKELVAQAIHRLAGRPGDFVAVNCASLSATLLESELFGHRKGAFSGATHDHPGLIRASDRGTLFLDEIGDMALPAQAALLRVLQERQVLPVGATRPIAVDLRVCAATHRGLDAMVEKGEFREDLLARINGFSVELPPLRERREDVGLLVRALLARSAPDAREHIQFLPAAARRLLTYDWPRNVRELEKALERALALATDGVVQPDHLGALSPRNLPRPRSDEAPVRTELERLLALHRGSISAVAREMGKDRVQIRRWMKRWGLSQP